jgi:hypothetical protein
MACKIGDPFFSHRIVGFIHYAIFWVSHMCVCVCVCVCLSLSLFVAK